MFRPSAQHIDWPAGHLRHDFGIPYICIPWSNRDLRHRAHHPLGYNPTICPLYTEPPFPRSPGTPDDGNLLTLSATLPLPPKYRFHIVVPSSPSIYTASHGPYHCSRLRRQLWDNFPVSPSLPQVVIHSHPINIIICDGAAEVRKYIYSF